MIKYTFAIVTRKTDFIVDARNPYNYEEVGSLIWRGDDRPSEIEFFAMRRKANIPEEALCISSKLLEDNFQ